MLSTVYSLMQRVMTFALISIVEFVLFFIMVKFATKEYISNLYKSFYKTYLEAFFFVLVAMGLMLFLKFKVGFQDTADLWKIFEQMYTLMLFLSLVLTCSMHYELFAQNKYKYSFVGLVCMLIFLMLYQY